MIKQYAVAALFCSFWLVLAVPTRAQDVEMSSREIIRVLQMPMEMKDFQNPFTLKEAIGLMYDKLASQGIDLPILVDHAAFRDQNPDAPDIYESVVKFAPYPKKMAIATMLQIALSQVPTGDTMFVIRRGAITITTAKHAGMEVMLKQKVTAKFDKRPIDEVIHELAEQTGVSIQLDNRVKDKQVAVVSALFRNDTSLHDALVMLADMANLQVVELPTGVYVTSPANAEVLKKAKLKK